MTRAEQIKMDDAFAQIAENEVKQFFEARNYDVFKVPIEEKEKYDFSVAPKQIFPPQEIFVEVKSDRLTPETGNVAVEQYKVINGKKMDSGLSVTKADYYIYKVAGEAGLFFVETNELRNYIETKCQRKGVSGGDDYLSRLALIPFKDFEVLFERLT